MKILVSLNKNKPKSFPQKSAQVICGFPGIGKTHFFNRQQELGFTVMDSDSSKFPKDDFPANYIKHIEEARYQCDYLLVSSHDAVRQALVDAGIEFTLIYPEKNLKVEYMQRYAKRGSPKEFLTMMNKNWANFLTSCVDQQGCTHVVLKAKQFMSDVIGTQEKVDEFTTDESQG